MANYVVYYKSCDGLSALNEEFNSVEYEELFYHWGQLQVLERLYIQWDWNNTIFDRLQSYGKRIDDW